MNPQPTNKLYIEAPVLADRLSILSPFYSERDLIPAYSAVRIQVAAGKLYLTVGNESASMTTTLPTVTGDTPKWGFCCAFKKLRDLVKNMQGELSIEVSATEPAIVLRNGKSKSKMSAFPVRDYPNPDREEPEVVLTLQPHQAKLFALALKRATPFVDDEDTRDLSFQAWVIPGENGQAMLAAFNGWSSMYLEELDCDLPTEGIPFTEAQVSMIQPMLFNVEEITIGLSDSWVSLKSSVERIMLRRRQGRAVEMMSAVSSIMSQVQPLSVTIPAEPLTRFIRKARAIHAEPKTVVILKWRETEWSYRYDTDEIVEEMDVQPLTDAAQIVTPKGMNAILLQDAIKAMESSSITIATDKDPRAWWIVTGFDFPGRISVIAPNMA